jgi:2-C-methyl-D-erythritol 4-phosphate cytidylyltransferase
MKYFVVIPAAGSGRRFNAAVPKQYAPLAGLTVVEHALAAFEADSDCARIVVAIAADDPHWPRVSSRRFWNVDTVTGGAQRAQSVRAGLTALAAHAGDDDWVMVHDAARPCFSPEDLAALKRELASHESGGLLAMPLADTLKRADASATLVDATIDRAGLWRAATPQVFRLGLLVRALDAALAAGRLPTDEAQAVEWLGIKPRLVAGRPDNIKVTTAEDLALAAAILAQRMTVEKN